jgi:hypothetical protein
VEHGLGSCSDSTEAEFQHLVDTQATLLSVVLALGNKKKNAKAYRTLSAMWRSVKVSEELYGNAVINSEPSTHIVVFGSHLIRYLTETKRVELINKYKVCSFSVLCCLLMLVKGK